MIGPFIGRSVCKSLLFLQSKHEKLWIVIFFAGFFPK